VEELNAAVGSVALPVTLVGAVQVVVLLVLVLVETPPSAPVVATP
jgi:hypothetical protein